MDTRTGELLSLADYPSFDAQQPLSSPEADLGSRALSDVYEPGSVEKVLTASALIDAGKLTPLTHIQVPGRAAPSRCRAAASDHWDHDLLRYTLAGVISRSSNIGTVLAARKFTPDELHGYLRDFGLGQRTEHRRPGRDRRPARRPVAVGAGQPGHHRLRPGPQRQRGPDGRRGQHHRQQRQSASTPAWSTVTPPPTTAPRSAPTPPASAG